MKIIEGNVHKFLCRVSRTEFIFAIKSAVTDLVCSDIFKALNYVVNACKHKLFKDYFISLL